MSDPENPHALSHRTTPTWEVELLISGVAVFAMLQLPSLLDDAMFALEPRLGVDWRQMLILGYLYGKSAALILATTFVLHLLLRARWIALVGMHSVHPQGILLDKLRLGPIQKALERERETPMPARIKRADNLATTVFAIGVMLATMLLVTAAGATALYALGVLIATLSGGWIDASLAMLAIFALITLPFIVLVQLDRRKGAHWLPGSWRHRAVSAGFRGYARIGFSHGSNPEMSLLSTNRGGSRKAILLTTSVMFVALASAGISLALQKHPDWLGSYAWFPKSTTRQLDSAHYDDQRNPARDSATPYVQSAVIVGPYLKLVIPYRPLRDDAAMRSTCPSTDAGRTGDALASARLACLQALHGVVLDGKPLASLRYEIASDPRTDRPALLAMIDVRSLPPGRHELRIAHPPRSDQTPGDDNPDPGFDVIPFWR